MEIPSNVYEEGLQRVVRVAAFKYDNLPREQVHASRHVLESATAKIVDNLPLGGRHLEATLTHLIEDICPALSTSTSPRYFGFVTGGSTPAAQLADFLVTTYDQNVQVHLPQCSVSTSVEDATLKMVLQLLKLEPNSWLGRTLTTGATASNILGLACGRNFVLHAMGIDVSEDGYYGARVEILCASAHASIRKAAGILGIGRANCIELLDETDRYAVNYDLGKLAERLEHNKREKIGSIVVASLGEVNTGLSTKEIPRIRTLCNEFNAWFHMDAAFAIFAGVYEPLSAMLDDLAFADSICVDGHKWLNVPYDTAMFFTTRKDTLRNVCASGPAAYLTAAQSSTTTGSPMIESPLNVGIENSRRFRALPLYSTLLAYGQSGYAEMIARNLEFARGLDTYMRRHKLFEVLTPVPAATIGHNLANGRHETTNIVLFTINAKHAKSSAIRMSHVVDAINATRVLYVTQTMFRNRESARIAVSNWRTGSRRRLPMDADRSGPSADLYLVSEALRRVIDLVMSCSELHEIQKWTEHLSGVSQGQVEDWLFNHSDHMYDARAR